MGGIRKNEKNHDMGKRKLAYEIRKKREGYYYLIYFSIDSNKLTEVLEELHLHEDLIRFRTMKASTVLENLEFKPLIEQNKE